MGVSCPTCRRSTCCSTAGMRAPPFWPETCFEGEGMKTILVTGGSGFIGSNFVRHIYHKYPDYRILVVDALTYAARTENGPNGAAKTDRYEFWYGDVRNGELMDSLVSQSDIVVHM